MPQMPFFLPLPLPLCYNDIVGTAEKPAFSCPDPQPIRYRENRRWSVPGPVVRNSGPRGIFPPNPSQNQKGPPHNPAGPVFIPSSPPGRHPAPAHLCRSAGLRPAGQTVLRTVLGGGLRPPPTAAPGAAGPAGLCPPDLAGCSKRRGFCTGTCTKICGGGSNPLHFGSRYDKINVESCSAAYFFLHTKKPEGGRPPCEALL